MYIYTRYTVTYVIILLVIIMFIELIRAFIVVFFAELGDKSQIAVMTFATKYKRYQVLIGVLIASILNHSIAVLLGANIQNFIDMKYISFISGLVFIVFAFLSFRTDDDYNNSKNKKSKYPIYTIAIIFFLSELGDKTQLSAIALSSDARYPLFILLGTVTAMFTTSLLAIIIGSKIGKRLNDLYIVLLSSLIFLGIGLYKIYDLTEYFTIVLIVVVPLYTYLGIRYIRTHNTISNYQIAAENLKTYYQKLHLKIEDLCHTISICTSCNKDECLIGYTHRLLHDILDGKDIVIDEDIKSKLNKQWDQSTLLQLDLEIIELRRFNDNNTLTHLHSIIKRMLK